MNPLSCEILSLSSEAALIVDKNIISFANDAACTELGSAWVGKAANLLFGTELLETQAPSFIADLYICGKPYTVRVSRLDGARIIFLSPSTTELPLLNDSFILSVRESLASISFAAKSCRDRAEDLGDKTILSGISSLTRSYYRILRLFQNAFTARGLASGNLPFEAREMDLSALLTAHLETISKIFPDIQFRMDVGHGITVFADPGLVEQLYSNLLSNCLIHSGCTHIAVNLQETAESAVISVYDNGCGIPPEKLHTVFDRYRHNFEISHMVGGCGLGLTVVRGIAEKHGGALFLESRVGQGCTVRVSLHKRQTGSVNLRSPANEEYYNLDHILVGLSDCLPSEYYSEKYMD